MNWLYAFPIILGIIFIIKLISSNDEKPLSSPASSSVGSQASQQREYTPPGSILFQLAEADKGLIDINSRSTRNINLYAKALDNIISQMSNAARVENPSDSTFFLSGVSIEPFSTIVLSKGANKCTEIIEVSGICMQNAGGLLCANEIYENLGGHELCLTSLRR